MGAGGPPFCGEHLGEVKTYCDSLLISYRVRIIDLYRIAWWGIRQWALDAESCNPSQWEQDPRLKQRQNNKQVVWLFCFFCCFYGCYMSCCVFLYFLVVVSVCLSLFFISLRLVCVSWWSLFLVLWSFVVISIFLLSSLTPVVRVVFVTFALIGLCLCNPWINLTKNITSHQDSGPSALGLCPVRPISNPSIMLKGANLWFL